MDIPSCILCGCTTNLWLQVPKVIPDADSTHYNLFRCRPATWSPAPAPASVLVRPGAGTNGSTRLEVTWADGSILNEWLQVTLKADDTTGLSAPDVFYFGNLVGETGKAATGGYFTVTSADEDSARNDPHSFLNPATITDVNDFNRDGRVDANDQLIARNALNDSLIDLSV